MSSWAPFSRRFAIADGWMAEGHLAFWRVVTTSEIVAVALVNANILRRLNTRALLAPGPLLVIRTGDGSLLKVDVKRLPEDARRKILWELPSGAEVANYADRFLRDGELPGRLGRPLRLYGFRFGKRTY